MKILGGWIIKSRLNAQMLLSIYFLNFLLMFQLYSWLYLNPHREKELLKVHLMQIEPFETTYKKCPARVSPLMINLSPLMTSLGARKVWTRSCQDSWKFCHHSWKAFCLLEFLRLEFLIFCSKNFSDGW